MRSSPVRAALLLAALACPAVTSACSGPVSVAPVTFTPYGSCNSYEGAALITGVTDYSLYCPGLTCEGAYYALCDGASWDSCACGVPSGDIVIAWSNFAGGIESESTSDAGSDGLGNEDAGNGDANEGDDVTSSEDDAGGNAEDASSVNCDSDF
jgi:hypothetical protein